MKLLAILLISLPATSAWAECPCAPSDLTCVLREKCFKGGTFGGALAPNKNKQVGADFQMNGMTPLSDVVVIKGKPKL